MKKWLILLIITLNLTANNHCKDYNSYSVENYVVELLMQSSAKSRLKDAHYFVSGGDDIIYIQAFLDVKDWVDRGRASSVETIGWFEYNLKSFKLYEDNIVDPDKPIEINYADKWRDVIVAVVSKKSRDCIEVKNRAWLYKKADKNSKSKKFLIKDDVAMILKRKKGWYKIYFLHSRFHTNTILWIKSKDVEEIRMIDNQEKF